MSEKSLLSYDPFSKPSRARFSRILAVQATYQVGFGHITYANVCAQFQKNQLVGMKGRKADKKLFASILAFLEQYPEKVEPSLEACLLPKWKLDRLEKVLQAILRVGSAEFHLQIASPGVLVSEYVQITQGFFEQDQDKLVHGVLDCLYKNLQENTLSS